MKTLRPYQLDAVNAVVDAIDEGYKRVLMTQSTGCGKTVTLAEIIKICLHIGKKVLFLAHRNELITQGYESIKEYCGLDVWEIGIERASSRAPFTAKVVIASKDSIRGSERLAGWDPDVIITDECHRAACKTYADIYARFGVGERCIHIGVTATPKRTDKQALYAFDLCGSQMWVEDRKTKVKRLVQPEEAIYERHVSDFGILQAWEDGWLAEFRPYVVETGQTMTGLKSTEDGDISEASQAKQVDNALRTCKVIAKWEDLGANTRPTLVFCASVEHAKHSAELWASAGYSAAYVSGNESGIIGELMPAGNAELERKRIVDAFKAGKIQVLCNMNVFIEGTDLPNCACVVLLRLTSSWGNYCQMVGRGSRPFPGGLVDQFPTAAERRAAIASSSKPDCILIDAVDIVENFNICSAPAILDLPVKLDLQGHTLIEAKKLLDEFAQAKSLVIGECPVTFERLESRLREVSLLQKNGFKSQFGWKVSENGFRFEKVPPGYTAEVTRTPESGGFRLVVTHKGEEIYNRAGVSREQFSDLLGRAGAATLKAIEKHKPTIAAKPRGTLKKFSEKQIYTLRRLGHSPEQIDTYPYKKAKGILDKHFQQKKEAEQNALRQPQEAA